MEEDPLLTPRPWWARGRWGSERYPSYHTRDNPSSTWAPGFVLLGLAAVVFPILLFVLSKL